jgi:hypothetical protein
MYRIEIAGPPEPAALKALELDLPKWLYGRGPRLRSSGVDT